MRRCVTIAILHQLRCDSTRAEAYVSAAGVRILPMVREYRLGLTTALTARDLPQSRDKLARGDADDNALVKYAATDQSEREPVPVFIHPLRSPPSIPCMRAFVGGCGGGLRYWCMRGCMRTRNDVVEKHAIVADAFALCRTQHCTSRCR